METTGQLTIGKRFAVLFGAMFILIVAVVLHVEYLYFMALALGAAPWATWVVGQRALRGVSATRTMPEVVTAGERFPMSLAVTNNDATRKQFLLVTDSLPRGLTAEGPAERWVVDLAPGETTEVQYAALARKRGVYLLGWVGLHSTDPIGMFSYQRDLDAQGVLVVHPRVLALPPIRPPAAGRNVSARVRTRKLGEGTDFCGLREYVPGDDLRRVHWKNSARRGKLTIVEYESSEANSLALALDLSPRFHAGEGEESTLEYGVTLAASVAAQCLRRGAEFSLLAEGGESRSLRALASPAEEPRVMDALARVRADAPSAFAETLSAFAQWLPPGAGVVVVSPAVGPEAVAAARRLTALGHGVLWISLVASSFTTENDASVPPESAYEELATALSGSRCEVRQIRRGDHPAQRLGVRFRAA